MGVAQSLAALGSSALKTAVDQGVGGAINYGFSSLAANKAYQNQKNLLLKGPYLRVQGLKLAGLNPILAAKGALGSGTPSVAAVAPSVGQSSAPHRAQTNLRKLQKAQITQAGATTSREVANARLASAQESLTNEQIARTNADAEISRINAAVRNAQSGAEITKAAVDQAVHQYYLDNPRVAIAKDFATTLGSLLSSAREVSGMARDAINSGGGLENPGRGQTNLGIPSGKERQRGKRRRR